MVSNCRAMKAIRVHQFGDPSVMKLEEMPDTSAGAGQVLVDVKAAGVNPVDTYIRSGQYAFLPPLPYTPGSDAAGVVAAVGSDVHDFKVGDRVYISGTIAGRAFGSYAERAVCTIDQVHHLPDHVSFAEGAGVGVPYVTAWRALFDKGARDAGRDGVDPRRKRRRRRRRHANGERSRAARLRHRGNRAGQAARARAGRA